MHKEKETLNTSLLSRQTISIEPGNYCNLEVEIPAHKARTGTVWTCMEQNSPYYHGLSVAARRISTKFGTRTRLIVICTGEETVNVKSGSKIFDINLCDEIDVTPSLNFPIDKVTPCVKNVVNAIECWEKVVGRKMFKNLKRKTSNHIVFTAELTTEKLVNQQLDAVKTFEQKFEEKLTKTDPTLHESLRFGKELFRDDEPGEWSPIDCDPIDIPLREGAENVKLKPAYKTRHSDEQKQVRDDFIAANLARGVIVESNSNVLAPLVIVKKPNGRGWRVCVDYRQTNDKIFDDCSHAIPEIDDIIQKVGNANVMSSVDISSAYWRAKITDNVKPYTSFVVHDGQFAGAYMWNFVPFGIKSAVSLFSRIMDECFRGIPNVIWYLDDILCYSKNMIDHARDLKIMFQRALARNFKFSLEKSVFGVSEITYLGHILGNGKIRVSEKTINRISAVETLAKVGARKKTWQQVFGFYNWSSRYIKNFARDRRLIETLIDQWNNLRNDFNCRVTTNLSPEEITNQNTSFEQMTDMIQNDINTVIKRWSEQIKNRVLVIPDKTW